MENGLSGFLDLITNYEEAGHNGAPRPGSLLSVDCELTPTLVRVFCRCIADVGEKMRICK